MRKAIPEAGGEQLRTVSRAAHLLELVVAEGPVTLKEVTKALGLGTTVAYRLLQTWVSLKYLQFEPSEKTYSAGPKVSWLGTRLRVAANSVQLNARLRQLSEELHETATAGILAGQNIIIVARSVARKLLVVDVEVGTLLPAHATALGQCLLAHRPKIEVEGLQPGSVGEVVVRGQNVIRGYRNNPQANAASFTHGWFRTGDYGVLDEAGYLTLVGRLKELINRGGEKISPVEVDEALMTYPGVLEAVAFGVPDEKYGEAVAAAIVVRKGTTADELRAHVAERLASFKVPAVVHLVEAIPRTATGKVQRRNVAAAFVPKTQR